MSPARGADGDQAFIATTVVLIAVTPALYQLAIVVGQRMLAREDEQMPALAD